MVTPSSQAVNAQLMGLVDDILEDLRDQEASLHSHYTVRLAVADVAHAAQAEELRLVTQTLQPLARAVATPRGLSGAVTPRVASGAATPRHVSGATTPRVRVETFRGQGVGAPQACVLSGNTSTTANTCQHVCTGQWTLTCQG